MVQILPPDDDFAAGSPSTSIVSLYIGCRLSSSSISGIWNPSGVFIVRAMHGGYQTINSFGVRDYNAAFHNNGDPSRRISGHMFRVAQTLGCGVRGTFEMRSLGGALGIGDLSPRGVFARCTGGSLVGDGTPDMRVDDPSAYVAAAYQKSSDSTLRFGIMRVNAGAFTVLAESAAVSTTRPLPCTFWTIAVTISSALADCSGAG